MDNHKETSWGFIKEMNRYWKSGKQSLQCSLPVLSCGYIWDYEIIILFKSWFQDFKTFRPWLSLSRWLSLTSRSAPCTSWDTGWPGPCCPGVWRCWPGWGHMPGSCTSRWADIRSGSDGALFVKCIMSSNNSLRVSVPWWVCQYL